MYSSINRLFEGMERERETVVTVRITEFLLLSRHIACKLEQID
jgi:hypothetical protein